MPFLEDYFDSMVGVPSIPEYYRGKTIFITGGTGFLGKVLLEKLLYSCPDLDGIYLLMRSKKGVKPEERLASLYALACFDRLRAERPGVFASKVFIVAGDCSESGLGMSEKDKELILNKTNIVYHSAASVRFDDQLKVATKLNLQSTKELIELAVGMQYLESFIHVSTSYSNTNRDLIEEIMYPPFVDWRDHLEICEHIDDHTLQVMTQKYIGEMPNTYAFTKQLAEHMVYEQKGKLPVVIIRPSIVTGSDREPMPGWIDNFHGPIGLTVASGKGIIRAIYCEPTLIPEFIPVDIVIKSLIAASWIRGTKKFEPSDDIPIYNSCAGRLKYITASDMHHIGLKFANELQPFDNLFWIPNATITPSKWIYDIRVWLQHLLPAMIIDILLWIFGIKPLLVKIHRRIYIANISYGYYLTHQWSFSVKNLLALRSKIKEEDKQAFYYDIEGIDVHEYYRNAYIGAKKYLLKEKDEDIPKARAHFRRLKLLDKVVNCVFYACIFWLAVKVISAYIPSV